MSKILDNNNEIELKNDFENTPETTKNLENFTNKEIIINDIENFENKKEIGTETLILNEFWVDLISRLIINLNIIYMEYVPIMLFFLFDEDKLFDISTVCSKIYKYIFFSNLFHNFQ